MEKEKEKEKEKKRSGLGSILEGLSIRATESAGGSWAFSIAVAIILVWALIGPMFGFTDTWQLVVCDLGGHKFLPSGRPDPPPEPAGMMRWHAPCSHSGRRGTTS